VEREPRFVHVYGHEIKEVRLPDIDFRVACSKGFYVRTYAFDIGNELGCGAHLKQLRRTKSGKFTLEHSVTVDEIKTLEPSVLRQRILSLPTVSRMRGA
jgi:tRNA pseudouridine55 synthase